MISNVFPSAYKLLKTSDRIPFSSHKVETGQSEFHARESLEKLKKVAAVQLERNTTPVVVTQVDMGNILEIRKAEKNPTGFIPYVTSALIATLRESLGMYGTEVPAISLAVGSENEKIVPFLGSLKDFSIDHISKALEDQGNRIRKGEIGGVDPEQKTFTIVNGGRSGSLFSNPNLLPNQLGMLGLSYIASRAVMIEDEIQVRPLMNLMLSYDYRIIDGKLAAPFLAKIKERLEDVSWIAS